MWLLAFECLASLVWVVAWSLRVTWDIPRDSADVVSD
jgi:hypothetical protein